MRDRPKQSERDRNHCDWICFRDMEKGLVSARPHPCRVFSLSSRFSKPLLEVRTEAVWHMLNRCLFRNCLLTTGTKLCNCQTGHSKAESNYPRKPTNG